MYLPSTLEKYMNHNKAKDIIDSLLNLFEQITQQLFPNLPE